MSADIAVAPGSQPTDLLSPSSPLAVAALPSTATAAVRFVSRGASFEFRRLQPSDRADVFELARYTYEGRDWIVGEFDAWMRSSDERLLTVACVYCGPAGGASDSEEGLAERAEFEQRVVSIEVVKFQDGGTTGWLCALRVHPLFRGLQLSSHVHSHLIAASQRRPGVLRLRETTASNNTVSLHLAAKHGFEVVYDSAYTYLHREQHASRMEWVERQLLKRGVALPDVRLREEATDGSGWLSRGTGEQLLALQRAKQSTSPDFRYMVIYWIVYEWTADNARMLTEEPGTAHEVVLSYSKPDAASRDVEAASMVRRTVDYTGALQAITVFATDDTHCLLHLHHALQREAEHVHDADRYVPSNIFVPMEFERAVKSDEADPWKADITCVLLERQLDHSSAFSSV